MTNSERFEKNSWKIGIPSNKLGTTIIYNGDRFTIIGMTKDNKIIIRGKFGEFIIDPKEVRRALWVKEEIKSKMEKSSKY